MNAENKARRQKAIELMIKGLTYSEIGSALGVSRQYAQQLVRPSFGISIMVRKRASGKCEECGVELRRGHIHHIDPQEENFNDYENLQYLCASCHGKAHGSGDEKVKRSELEIKLDKARGGRTRAERLTPERRSEIARKAAQARWRKRVPNSIRIPS